MSVGEVLELREFGKDNSFTTARVTKVIEKPFGELTESDKAGHETFSSDEEMYKTYSGYYNIAVTSETKVKIIWFELLERL